MRIREQQRGNVLAITFAVIFIMLTLVSALHYQQSTARRKVTRASAHLQFSQGRKFAVMQHLQSEGALVYITDTPSIPSHVKVVGDVDEVENGLIPAMSTGELHGTLANVAAHKADDPVKGHQLLDVTPKSSDNALRVFGRRKWRVAIRKNDAYAVYAPKGNITLGSLRGWANPTFKDERADMANAFSGQPATARALQQIDIKRLEYGTASAKEGPIEIDEGLGVPFLGPGPLKDYNTELASRLETVKASLEGTSTNGDKSSNIRGTIFDSIGRFFELLVGRGSVNSAFSPTLQQALRINIPVIPGFSATVPGTFFEIWFHVPFPADGGNYQESSNTDSGSNRARELQAAHTRAREAEDELQRVRNNPNSTQAQIDRAQRERDRAVNRLAELEQDVRDQAEADNNRIRNRMPSGPAEAPVTREDDENVPKDGTKNWNYSNVLTNLLDLLFSVVSGDIDGLINSMAPPVRVVHFGDKENNSDESFDFSNGTFTSEATWTVPQGRTFRYDQNMEIIGDLWIQKGAVFSCGGDLTLKRPANSSVNPFAPKGRLILEEGASLVVNGDFAAEGSSTFGSVLVCSRPNQIHGINTSILCGGSVELKYGTFPALTLADGVRWVGDETETPAMNDAADVTENIFANVLPNLAKLAGPFHTRRPYFAKYATTFQLTIIPTPVGPVPVPSAIPLPRRNGLVGVFKALTFLYTPTLNWALGENLYCQSDWWYFGQGNVPVLPKLDPDGAVAALRSFNLGNYSISIDFGAVTDAFTRDVLTDIAVRTLVEVAQRIGAQIIASIVPGAGFVVDEIIAQVSEIIDRELGSLEDLVAQLVRDALSPLVTPFTDILDDVRRRVEAVANDVYLRELPGVLIYADSIQVGDSPLNPALASQNSSASAKLISGMLVAKRGINLNCRFAAGTFVALDGDVVANTIQYVPYYGAASIYIPKQLSTNNWLTRGGEIFYGREHDSKTAIDVSTGRGRVVFEGWSQ